jgi:poly(3-hydroxybutyrate) depolymerase
MLYQLYQAQSDMLAPVRAFAGAAMQGLGQLEPFFPDNPALRRVAAGYEFVTRAGLTHDRPPFGIESVKVGRRQVAVTEEPGLVTPFGTLLHFKKDLATPQPRVLVVAPLSGHFASLLRNTVRTLLPDNDVYITDWHNARDVCLGDGTFGFHDYTELVIRFMETIGPGAHMLAVCQPCVSALVATAAMAEDGNPAVPRSLTLMAGPIDASANPTEVNDLATSRPIEWFERHVIASVPLRYRGRFRRVYPGFLQLAAFVSMNPDRHLKAHASLYDNLISGNDIAADTTKAFYDDYFAVLDLPAEFYLETVQIVFQEYRLARGTLEFRGRPVNPAAIRRTGLLTVEGARDDICSVGQTVAAQDLCTSLKPQLRSHHLQAGVGHYGVFSGSRWEQQIYPVVRRMILATD